MKKNDRINQFVAQLAAGDAPGLDRRYTGFFVCFNAQQYYEAHDVLEHLWLETTDANHGFFKGLIQVAGAFVHLQKQYLHPTHAKHGRRLAPAARLFDLAARNLAPYAPVHWRLDVDGLRALCAARAAEIVAADFLRNPWQPTAAPQLDLLPA